MRRRNCEDCKHYKITTQNGEDFHYCAVWVCEFERKDDTDEEDDS